MAVTRYADGVSTAASTATLASFGMCDPALWQVYFNDFMDLRDVDATNGWVITTVELGTGDSTETINDAAHGELLITNADAITDLDYFQSKYEVFRLSKTDGKKLFFKARLKVSDVVDTDFFMGLQIRDTSPLDATDGIFFMKNDNDAELDFHVMKNSTSIPATAIAVIHNNTFFTVGFYYNGASLVEYFVNDVSIGTVGTTNLPDDEELAISFGIKNGAAAVKTMTVDYVFCAKEK